MRKTRQGLARAALTAAALAVLAGCGDLSLYRALENDSPGPLRFSPTSALVPEETSFNFTVLGGFLPYDVAVEASLAGGITPKDEHTWTFPATTITTESEVFQLKATDLLGKTAAAEVTVYKLPPLALSVQNVTLLQGDSWTFRVSGGKLPYDWYLDNSLQSTGDSYLFAGTSAGTYTVSVKDAIGVTRAALVQVVVVPPDAPLQITPTSVTVLRGGSIVFTALGGAGGYNFIATGGTITPEPDGNPATYLAETQGPQTVSVGDGAETATAAVMVVTSLAQALSLSPDSPTVSAVGDTIAFSASGGSAPYTFSTDHPSWGSIAASGDGFTALYAQLAANRNVMVRVTDANGTMASTMVKWK
jgi:hypothetical protein